MTQLNINSLTDRNNGQATNTRGNFKQAFKYSLLTLAVGQALAISSADAATIRVNDFSDVSGANCTLRQAILSANTDNSQLSGCTAGSGADVILFDTTTAQAIALTEGRLSIESNLQIKAPTHAPILIDASSTTSNGIYIRDASVTLERINITGAPQTGVNIDGNSVVTIANAHIYGNGQGINSNGILTINNSTIANNSSALGGAGLLVSGTININASTISNNTTSNRGGGLFINSGIMNIDASTITGNSAASGGGGIETNSFSASVTITNSIVSGNSAPISAEVRKGGTDTITTSNSLFGSSATSDELAFGQFTSFPLSTNDINANSDNDNIDLSAILSPLGENGGPTPTHDLVTGSVAIDRVSGDSCDTPDQRNERRSNTCDIGAVEFLPTGQVITVTTALGSNGNAYGFCSLFHAIQAVNTNRTSNGCSAGGVNDTIAFSENIDSITLTAVLPTILSDVTIEGGGITIDANNTGRVLAIAFGPKVMVDNINLTGYGGGLVANFDADVTISNSTITGNSTANNGGGVAVSNRSVLRVIDSSVSNNQAANGGGAFAQSYGRLELVRSTISNNTAVSSYGGGVSVNGAEAKIINSTISGNSASFNGGGVFVYGSGATTDIVNSTITENETFNTAFTGGIVSKDVGSTINLENSIVSNNSNYEASLFADGIINANKNNLFGDSAKLSNNVFYGFTPGLTDIVATSDGTNPQAASAILGPLANNGGATLTHELVAASPAINAGSNTNCPATDQRGESRSDGKCDIGAFEYIEGESCYVVKAANGNVLVFCL